MRKIIAIIEIDDERAVEADMGTIEYIENEFGWLEQSGIYLEDIKILDSDDPSDKKAIEAVETIKGDLNMPNYVVNKVEFCGKQEYINDVLNLIKGENNHLIIDFEKIIPMPDNIYRGDLGKEEKEKYGKNNWYDWSIDHWGTKWNAYDQCRDGNIIYFSTAWSIPHGIYEKLAEICDEHGVSFSGSWCSEDWSADSGTFDAIDGAFYPCCDDIREEHIERCKELWNYDPTDEEE